MMRGRWLWISIAGIATFVLALWPEPNDEPEVRGKRFAPETGQQSVAQIHGEAAVRSGAEGIETLRLENLVREKAGVEKVNPFASTSWYQPPAQKIVPQEAPPPPPPPPPPTAPPMPFSYMGSYEDGSKRQVLLLRGGQMYTVSEGDNIDNLYRIESIEGDKVEIVYLPLGIKQVLDTGEKAFSGRKKGQ